VGKTPVHIYSLAIKELGNEFGYKTTLPLARNFIANYDWSREGSGQIATEIPSFMCKDKGKGRNTNVYFKITDYAIDIAKTKGMTHHPWAEKEKDPERLKRYEFENLDGHAKNYFLQVLLADAVNKPESRKRNISIVVESIDQFLKSG
jgi:hypothetical protein